MNINFTLPAIAAGRLTNSHKFSQFANLHCLEYRKAPSFPWMQTYAISKDERSWDFHYLWWLKFSTITQGGKYNLFSVKAKKAVLVTSPLTKK
jgi:hypothetical protein